MTATDLMAESFFEQVTFSELTLRDVELYARHFDGCSFESCDMSGVVFDECTFSDCRFENCNLSLVKLPHTQMGHTSFSECKMVGIDWTAAKWRKSTGTKRVAFPLTFDRCILDYSIFMSMNMYGVKFDGCSLREVRFEGSDMQCANFTGSDLEGALFADTILTRADLSGARNYTINACVNTLTKAKFSMPEAAALVYALDIVVE